LLILIRRQQRLLEIVRGLASSPKLILLDEPAAGMNNSEKDELNILMKKIMGQGVTILLVEHDMHLVMNTADHIFVLNSGELISQGTPEHVQQDPAVIATAPPIGGRNPLNALHAVSTVTEPSM
jgi:branched-chain amino acid transport system ATP-binding protein